LNAEIDSLRNNRYSVYEKYRIAQYKDTISDLDSINKILLTQNALCISEKESLKIENYKLNKTNQNKLYEGYITIGKYEINDLIDVINNFSSFAKQQKKKKIIIFDAD